MEEIYEKNIIIDWNWCINCFCSVNYSFGLKSASISDKQINKNWLEGDVNAFESNEITIELSKIFETNKKSRNSFAEDEVLKFISVDLNNDEVMVDYNGLLNFTKNLELLEIIDSNEFRKTFLSSFKRYDFYVENGVTKYDYLGENSLPKEVQDNYGLKETEKEILNKNRSVLDLVVSNNDYKIISHWYWFGWRKIEMTNNGRRLFVDDFMGNMWSSISVLKNYLTVLWHLLKDKGIVPLVIFISVMLAFLLINFATLLSATLSLKGYVNSGAYIGYYAATGTVTNWGKK